MIFFLIIKKEVYSRNYLMKTKGKTKIIEKETNRKKRKETRKQQRANYKREN